MCLFGATPGDIQNLLLALHSGTLQDSGITPGQPQHCSVAGNIRVLPDLSSYGIVSLGLWAAKTNGKITSKTLFWFYYFQIFNASFCLTASLTHEQYKDVICKIVNHGCSKWNICLNLSCLPGNSVWRNSLCSWSRETLDNKQVW